MSSERIPQIAIATAIVFATVILLESQKFILPFGLYKVGMFVCVILILIADRKKLNLSDWLLLGWTSAMAISSTFMLQFFFTEENIMDSEELISSVLSLIQLVGYILLFLWQFSISKGSTLFSRVFQLIGALGMLSCFLLNQNFWLIIPTLVWFFGLAIEKKRSSNYGMSLLLFFVVASCWISGLFFGMNSVVAQL